MAAERDDACFVLPRPGPPASLSCLCCKDNAKLEDADSKLAGWLKSERVVEEGRASG